MVPETRARSLRLPDVSATMLLQCRQEPQVQIHRRKIERARNKALSLGTTLEQIETKLREGLLQLGSVNGVEGKGTKPSHIICSHVLQAITGHKGN